jgi:hypothetical protein
MIKETTQKKVFADLKFSRILLLKENCMIKRFDTFAYGLY